MADTLKSGAAKGLGGTTFGADDYRNTLKAYLEQNIYAFSGARSLYMAEQYRGFLTGPDGKLLSQAQFISKVADLNEIDNVTYLKAERNSAIACAQAAEKWEGLKSFAALEYRSIGEHACPICSGLNGIVLATDDPRWRIIYVPNHFGCVCNVVPASTNATLTPDADATARVKAAKVPTYFRRNVGQQRVVFSDNHPYIEKYGEKKLSELDAEKNYGLRSGEKIYDMDDLPEYKGLNDKATANAWWQDMAGSQRGSFDLEAADGLTVRFDNNFRVHVLDENGNDRYRFIKQAKDVLQKPDEVWTNRIKGKVTTIYIKFYADYPLALVVDADKEVRAVTFYEVQKGGKLNYDALTNIRKGALKYKSR